MASVRPAAGRPSASAVRRWGDEYQDLTALASAVDLLNPDSLYKNVELEAIDSAHVDDVVRRAKDGPDLFIQLKWAVQAASQVDVDFLTTRRGKNSKSLLEKLLASWRQIRRPDNCPLIELATNRVLDTQDPLLVLVDGRTGLLAARHLSPRSRAGIRFTELVDHAGCQPDELLDLFDHLIFTVGQTVKTAYENAQHVMHSNGLRADDDAVRTGIRAVGEWIRDGRRAVTADFVHAEADRLRLLNKHRRHGDRRTAHPAVPDFTAGFRELAPTMLRDRTDELQLLHESCAGPSGYQWWQAEPWAGKTALMASFAAHPPPDIDVVAFFAVASDAAQSSRSAFTDAVSGQLSVLLNRPLPQTSGNVARDALRSALLHDAAAQARRNGRQLVLLVDGLDEDTGAAAGTGLGSIAAALPRAVPDGLHVIVSSRTVENLPDDVPGDHPLRSCPVHSLTASPHASDIERSARTELREQLVAPSRARILALVAASGGGITLEDLEDLTALPLYELQEMLQGALGRTVVSFVSIWSASEKPHRGLRFAHETLRETANQRLGARILDEARQQIIEWADLYRDQGWPPLTPVYLLRGYVPMLRTHGDHERLANLAVDRARHKLMLEVTGSDADAVTEVETAQGLLLQQAKPDLLALLRISIYQGELIERNANLPAGLPAVWARLGHRFKADALAKSISAPAYRSEALLALLGVDQRAADDLLQQAEDAAQAVDQLELRSRTLGLISKTARELDEPAIAERLLGDAIATVRRLENPAKRATALAELLFTVGDRQGLLTEAETALAQVQNAVDRVQSLATTAAAYFRLGNTGRWLTLMEEASTIEVKGPYLRSAADSALSIAWTTGGAFDRAEDVIDEIQKTSYHDTALAVLIDAVATEDPTRARTLMRKARRPLGQAACYTALARALADSDDYDAAIQLAEQAEHHARTDAFQDRHAKLIAELAIVVATELKDPKNANALLTTYRARFGEPATPRVDDENANDWVWSSLGPAAIAAGDTASGLRYITAINEEWLRSNALTEAARILADSGDLPAAEKFAREADDTTGKRSEGLRYVVRSALATNGFATASRIAHGIDNPKIRAAALAELAIAQTNASDTVGARTTIATVVGTDHNNIYDKALSSTAIAPAAALHDRHQAIDLCDRARRHAAALSTHPPLHDLVLVSVAHTLGQLDEPGRANEAAQEINDPATRASALADLSRGLVGTVHAAEGFPLLQQASRIARSVPDARRSTQARTDIALAWAAHGEWEQAQQTIEEITALPSRASALTELATQAVDESRENTAWNLMARSLAYGLPWSPAFAVIARLDPTIPIRFALEITDSTNIHGLAISRENASTDAS